MQQGTTLSASRISLQYTYTCLDTPHALRVRARNLHSLRQADEMSARFMVTGMIKRYKTHSQTDRQLLVERNVSNFPNPEDRGLRM
jgi:hypothetical protein